MSLSFENVPRGVVHFEWSSLLSEVLPSPNNMWPLRQRSHSTRFYNQSKTRKYQNNESQLRLDIVPITMKVEVDNLNKQKSHSSVSFCSTSKVKYKLLRGPSQDSLSLFNWNDSHNNFFPSISRPTSRPIILHGTRYTVLAVEEDTEQLGTCFNTKEEDKYSQKTERCSEQRRRFIDVERRTVYPRMYRDKTKYNIHNDYCISGRRMMLKSSRESFKKRLNPNLNLQQLVNEEESYVRKNVITNNMEEGKDHNYSLSRTSGTSQTPIIPTVDYLFSAPNLSERKDETDETRSFSLTEVIKSAINDFKTVQTDKLALNKAKSWIKEFIKNYLEEILEINEEVKEYVSGDTDNIWRLLFPKEIDNSKDEEINSLFEERFGKDMSQEVGAIAFVTTMFNDEDDQEEMKSLWLKTISLLNVSNPRIEICLRITLLIQRFKQDDQSLKMTHAKIHFWIKLFYMLFRVNDEMILDLESYLKILVKIMLTKMVLVEDSETFIERKIKTFYEEKLHKGQEDVKTVKLTMVHFIETILWIFSTTSKTSFHSFSFDEMASLLLLSNHFDN